MDGRLVTPEAVRLDLQTATVATRALARLLDLALQVVVLIGVTIAFSAIDDGSASATAITTVVLLAVFIVRILYPVLMEVRVGGTLGHLALGLRIVTLEGTPIRVRQALTRAAVGLFEIEATSGLVALLVAASRTDGRRLGDLAAGTQAVSVRVGTGPAVALDLEVPPRLRAWVETIDGSGLGQPERTALRRYLSRAGTLAADRRDELAAQLAEKLLPRLAASRPPGVSAHEVLVAIAAVTTAAPVPPPAQPGTATRQPAAPPPPAPPAPGEFHPPA